MFMKKGIRIVFIIIIIWIAFFTTDFIRTSMNKPPIFAYPAIIYKDGGSRECYGIGYKVNVYVSMDVDRPAEIFHVEIGFWSMPFDDQLRG